MREAPADPVEGAPLIGAVEGGGTKFVCAVGYSPEQILARVVIPTTDPATTLHTCVEFFQQQGQRLGAIAALGIASFGPLQLRTDAIDYGCLQRTPKPGWSGANILAPLKLALNLPCTLDTDVGAAAQAEWQAGAGQGLESIAYVTVGTGIGGALAPGLHAMQRMMHAEMGHIPVRRHLHDQEFAGACPFHGDCLEGLASGPAIRSRWGCDLASLPADHPGRLVIASYLAQLSCSIALLHGAQRIVFGGGVMADGTLLPLVRRAAHGYLNEYLQPLRGTGQMAAYLVPAALGDNAAIAGGILQARSLLPAFPARPWSSA